VARRVKPAYFHHEACRRRHARLVRDMALGTRAPTARAEFAWAATRPDGHELLARFQGPLLLVSGAQDPLCPRRWQIEMADAQPQARWVELPRVGHFVPLEAPAPLRDELIRWMRSQVATPPFASPSS
jgi:pimeloyl-ACP methyl ester carboxylesterase